MISSIFVPSKGRAGTSKTIENLWLAKATFTVVVEPQEAFIYRKAYPYAMFLVLPANDRGIGFVRQFILEKAREEDLSFYWMLDDDITSMFEVRDRRCIKTEFTKVLQLAQAQFMARADVGQGALEYQQFAWSATFPFKFNSYCDVAVFINVGLTRKINYRSEMDLKEDRDFTIQLLHSGLRTMRTCWLAFGAPKNGSNTGGLQKIYKQVGRELEAVKRMVEAWPTYCSPQVKKDGRQDVKINWKAFRS